MEEYISLSRAAAIVERISYENDISHEMKEVIQGIIDRLGDIYGLHIPKNDLLKVLEDGIKTLKKED